MMATTVVITAAVLSAKTWPDWRKAVAIWVQAEGVPALLGVRKEKSTRGVSVSLAKTFLWAVSLSSCD